MDDPRQLHKRELIHPIRLESLADRSAVDAPSTPTNPAHGSPACPFLARRASGCTAVSLDTAVPGLVAVDGPERTFEDLYRQISPRLRGYLRAAEPAEADDLEADVWLAIIGQLDRFVGDENGFQALVFTIARRRVTDHRRRRYRRRTDLVGNDSLSWSPGLRSLESDVMDGARHREPQSTSSSAGSRPHRPTSYDFGCSLGSPSTRPRPSSTAHLERFASCTTAL